MTTDPMMLRVTKVLMDHGHYTNEYGQPDESPNAVEWMVSDAEHIAAVPVTYDELEAVLLDVGLHHPGECTHVCITALIEALS